MAPPARLAAPPDDLAAFVAAESPALLRLARAMTGNAHDAWDLVQETLVRVGERWSRIDHPAAYARTVMTRLNIDRVRRLRREAPSWFTGGDRAEEVGPPDSGWWLAEALATLPPRQRTALALRYVEDLDVAGIAHRMGCSAGTVKSHLSRGTERLRSFASEHGHLAVTPARPTENTDSTETPDSTETHGGRG